MHEACRFAYTIVRSVGETYGPVYYKGEDAVQLCVLLSILLEGEAIREDLEDKKPLLM